MGNDGTRATRGRPPRRGALPLIAALGCLGASVVVVSCGTDADKSSAETQTSTVDRPGATYPNVVTEEEIGHYPEGSPQRAVLDWFQSVQFRDEAGVRANTTSQEVERVSRGTLDAAVRLIGPALGKPRIVSTRSRGDEAAIRLFVQSFVPGRVKPVGETPTTFRLTRASNKWRVNDVRYLIAAWAEIRKREP